MRVGKLPQLELTRNMENEEKMELRQFRRKESSRRGRNGGTKINKRSLK